MKFAQLEAGETFIWKGRHYLKVTPLMALAEDDEAQQLIPRSAEVRPAGGKRRDALSHPADASAESQQHAITLYRRSLLQHLDDIRRLPEADARALIDALARDATERLLSR